MPQIATPPRIRAALAAAVVGVAAALAAPPALAAQDAPVHPDPEHGRAPAQPAVTEGVDFRVYDGDGAAASLADVLAAAWDAEVLLVGEEHDDMPGHAVETLLLEGAISALRDTGRPVVLSMEMFERDVQYVVDEYLRDEITEDHFLRSARPWDDYEARYRPLVEAAKAAGDPIVAANAPRRYVNRVTREGPGSLETLSDLARSYLPPLPYPGPSDAYRAEWDALMAEAMAEMSDAGSDDEPEADEPADEPAANAPAEPGEGEPPAETVDASGPDHQVASNAIYSQALWDASMGHAITTALVEHLGALVIHYVGSFHVANGTGIPERIQDYRPGTRVRSVVMTKVDDIDAFSPEEHAGLGDFVVLTRKPAESEAGGG